MLPAMFAVVLAVSCGKHGSEGGPEERKVAGETIVETGEVVAVNSKVFVMPRYGRYWYQMKVIDILDHGTMVKAGDPIIELDPTEIQKFITDRESNLETQEATFQKMLVDQENRVQEAESKIRNEVASFNLKQIELESSRFESERIKRIKELEFEQAEITLAKEKRKLELANIVNENDLIIQKTRVDQIRSDIDNAYALLPELIIRTPIPGVFQIARNNRTRELVKVGDDIYQGNKLAEVPDLEWMKIETQVNETDFRKIHLGQKVAVRLDALPKVVFDGEIEYIGKLCRKKDNNSRQKIFDVEVKILESDLRLKPGMTVSCEFL